MPFKLTFSTINDRPEYHGSIPHQWPEIKMFTGTMYAYCRVNLDTQIADQLHIFHSCRDYMSDYMVASTQAEELAKINNTPPVYRNQQPSNYHGTFGPEIGLLLGRKGNLAEKLPFLNTIEKNLGVKRTEVHETDKPGHVVVLMSDWWKRTSLHWSWYMQTLRYLNDPKVTKPGDMSEAKSLSERTTHWNYMNTPDPFDYWKFPVILKLMGKPTKGHSNVKTGQYYHGAGGYHTFMWNVHGTFARNQPEAANKMFVYTQEIYEVLKEEKQKCAVSPATVS